MLARRISGVLAASAVTLAVTAPPVLASCYPPPEPPKKCNSGNGNGSDPITFVSGAHCYGGDPGNSYFHDKGGDEIPTSGGIPNPGGNNVP